MRLIDADAAKLTANDYKIFRCQLGGLVDVVEFLDDMPTVDAVRVVRCKDCKHYNEDCMSPHSGWCECLERGEYNEHFCSYGERRKE